MKRVLVICPYPEAVAPSQRLKYEQYFNYLRSCGFELTVSPFMTMRMWKIVYRPGRYLEKAAWTIWGYFRRIYDLIRAPFYDGIYISLQFTPFGGSGFERLARLMSRRMIYDIDDLVFLGKSSSANKFLESFKSPSKIFYQMKAADHVITCTPYLDAIARKHNPRTTDISSTINTETYVPREPYLRPGPLVLGWSGSHSTSPYLKLLRQPLAELQRKHSVKLLAIGDSELKIEGVELEAIPWVEKTEISDLQRIDIGLYPLPDEEWVLGKSGLKALQYMALGIPTVATAIGTNFRVIEDGESGFLAKSEEDWYQFLEKLILDPALRDRIGRAGRLRVERLYSVKANAPTYLEVFRQTYSRQSGSDSSTSRE